MGRQLGAFRSSLAPFWGLVGFLMLVLLPMAISRIVRMEPFSWARGVAALSSLLLVPILTFGFLAPFVRFFRIGVYELGLRAFNAYGRCFSVRWTSMVDAHRVNLLMLPYLRVRTSQPRVELMIPLFLARQADFERLVIEHAGRLNPIARHFEKSGVRGGQPGEP